MNSLISEIDMYNSKGFKDRDNTNSLLASLCSCSNLDVLYIITYKYCNIILVDVFIGKFHYNINKHKVLPVVVLLF